MPGELEVVLVAFIDDESETVFLEQDGVPQGVAAAQDDDE